MSPHEGAIPTRQSLLARLKNLDDQTSWREFFDTYWRLIYDVARRAGLTDAEAQDIVQETIIYVARKMPDFRYDPEICSFKGWLMQTTRWRIIDQIRKKQYQSHGKRIAREERLATSILERQADPASLDLETVWDEEWRKNLINAAIEKVKGRVSPALFQMFHLHVVKKYPAKQVAQRLGAKLAEVYFAKYKVSALIRKQIKLLENKPL
jgi:RNA polymerase sigma-70 factor (ECF subfamily)